MPPDGSGGFFLLLTESFAVRAMLGSLAAAGLVYLAVRTASVRTSSARRWLVLAPVTAAAVTAVLSMGEAFLPRLWVATTSGSSAGQLLDFLGEPWFLTPQRELDVLVITWATVAGALLVRRLAGALRVRRLLAAAHPPVGYGGLVPVVDRLAAAMGMRSPELLLLPRCPGGAFTARTMRPVIAVDPAVVDGLDARETEGLLAHELAHIRRRDNLVVGAIGAFRDLTFFLPPVHVAARWLRLEREEGADEVACLYTNRPGALASGILKVWDTCRITRRAVGCAAVPGRPLALAGGGTVTSLEAIEQRVERLVQRPQPLTGLRRRVELGVAGVVTAAAVCAAIAVPAWMVSRYDAAAIAVGYLAAPPVAAVESPAFATFRRLAPEAGTTDATERARGAATTSAACPCIESRTQWLEGAPTSAAASPRALTWGAADRHVWELESARREHASRDARPLLTVSDPAQHVGFFVVGAPPGGE